MYLFDAEARLPHLKKKLPLIRNSALIKQQKQVGPTTSVLRASIIKLGLITRARDGDT
jgi:hypothetical protein